MTILDRMTRHHHPYTDGGVRLRFLGGGFGRILLMVLTGLIGAGAGIALDSAFNLFSE